MNNISKNKLFIILSITSIFIIVPIICTIENQINIVFGGSEKYNIENIFDILIIFFTDIKVVFIWSVIQIILFLLIYTIRFTIKNYKIENKGINFKSDDGTFGTANWMNEKELLNSFELETGDGLIVGKLNNKIVTLPNDTLHNKNVAIFGASGSKKSRRICYTKYS